MGVIRVCIGPLHSGLFLLARVDDQFRLREHFLRGLRFSRSNSRTVIFGTVYHIQSGLDTVAAKVLQNINFPEMQFSREHT